MKWQYIVGIFTIIVSLVPIIYITFFLDWDFQQRGELIMPYIVMMITVILFLSLPLFIVGMVVIKKALPKEERKKLVAIEESKEEKEGGFENKHDKCPYCNSDNITRMLMKSARTKKERDSLGFLYQFECQCFNCNSKWESIEK